VWLADSSEFRNLETVKENPEYGYLINHIIKFYTSFYPTFRQVYESQLEGVNKPIRDNEKLSNWNKVDIVNLKININHFHKGVNRALKLALELANTGFDLNVLSARRKKYLVETVQAMVDNLTATGIEKENFEHGCIVEDDGQGEPTPVVINAGEGPVKLTAKKINSRIDNWRQVNTGSDDALYSDLFNRIVKSARVVNPNTMLEILDLGCEGGKPKGENYCYNSYLTAIDHCNDFISTWCLRLQDATEAATNIKLRSLNDFFKTMKNFGIKDTCNLQAFSLNDWLSRTDMIEVAQLPNLLSGEKSKFGLDISWKEKLLKIERRFYVSIDH
jgi:hypothetical protein